MTKYGINILIKTFLIYNQIIGHLLQEDEGLTPTLISDDGFEVQWIPEEFDGSGDFTVTVPEANNCEVQYPCEGSPCIINSHKDDNLNDCGIDVLLGPCGDITVNVARELTLQSINFNLAPAPTSIINGNPQLKITGNKASLSWTAPAKDETNECATRIWVSLEVDSGWSNSTEMPAFLGSINSHEWILPECEHGDLYASAIYLTVDDGYDTNQEFTAFGSDPYKGVGVTGISAEEVGEKCSLVTSWDVACNKADHYTATCGGQKETDIKSKTYTFSGLSAGPQTINVQAFLSDGDAIGTSKTISQDVSATAPDAPTMVSVTGNDDSPDELLVTWNQPTSTTCAADITGYTIIHKVVNTPHEALEAPSTLNTSTLHDLEPCTNYSVSVKARSEKGDVDSLPMTGKTGSKAPGSPDVTVASHNASTIALNWTTNLNNTCPLNEYKVTWLPNDNGGEEIVGEDTMFSINKLICNTNYTITVTVYTDDKSTSSTETKQKTDDQAPEETTVPVVTPVEDNATQLTVVWSGPEGYSCTGGLGEYSVTCTAEGEGEITSTSTKNVTDTTTVIDSLIPCTFYTCSVAARSNTGILGNYVNSTATETSEDVPGNISNIVRESFTPYSLNVTWNPPPTSSPDGNPCSITNYTVQWINSSNEADVKTENVTEPNLNIADLGACTNYFISVIAYTDKGPGASSDNQTMSTGVDAPKVDDDKVYIHYTSRDANVSWDKPETHCNLTYIVEYSGNTKWTYNQTSDPGKTQKVDDPNHSVNLDELLPFTEYNVCITVKDNMNGEITCNSFTTEEAVPSAPRNVSVDDYDDVSLTLTWDYPAAENGILRSYIVFWGMDGGSLSNYTVDDNIISHTIDGLEEGIYIFTVIAVNNKGPSEQSESIAQDMEGPTVCGVGCIIGIVIGVLLVALAIPAFIFRERIMNKIKSGPPPVEESPYELRGAAILKSDFRRHVEDMGLDRAEGAYQMLNDESQQKAKFAATKPFNKAKNRFANIHPFDETRVKLDLVRNGPKGSDYINANHITFPGNFDLEFIATQGPLDSTINDFYRMIWEHNVYDAVMLCNLFEKGKSKCAQYWNENGQRSVEFGEFTINCQTEEEDESRTFITRYLDISKDGQHRILKQHHFVAWPDFGVPETEDHLLRFLKFIKNNFNKRGNHILTHCSAGVGRTGTFIALWVLTGLLEQNKSAKSIDVHKIALMMREGRSDMIQTKDQYLYLHKCLLKYLENMGNSVTVSNKDDEEPIYGNLNTAYQH